MTVVRTACALTLLFAVTGAAAAQSSLGAGGVLCRDYLKAARAKSLVYHEASNWLLGYISGMNSAMTATKGSPPPINRSNDELLISARDYCEGHPDGTVADAASQWYALIPRQAAAPAAAPPKEASSGGSLILNLDRAPDRRPILDRR